MAKPIQVPDDVHERLKARADRAYRSLGGEISYLIDTAERVEAGAPQKGTPEKDTPQDFIRPVKLKRTPVEVMSDIKSLEREMESSINQDPDYWAGMNQRKQALWDEYHATRAEGPTPSESKEGYGQA